MRRFRTHEPITLSQILHLSMGFCSDVRLIWPWSVVVRVLPIIRYMGARTHGDLIAWQLASQLRRLVFVNTGSGPVTTDFDFRRQIRRSSRSACYLTSEGFYRYRHKEFAHFLNLAHGSLGEALDQIDEGREENYFTEEQHTQMKRLCLRAMKANVKLRASLTMDR